MLLSQRHTPRSHSPHTQPQLFLVLEYNNQRVYVHRNLRTIHRRGWWLGLSKVKSHGALHRAFASHLGQRLQLQQQMSKGMPR